MKGASEWIWVVGSIIAAIIIFTIAYNQIASSNRTILEQRSIDQFNEIVNNIQNLCWSFVGNQRKFTATLGDMVEGIYATIYPYDEYEKGKLINNIILNKNSTGNNLCLKITERRLNCKKLDCNVTFPFIGYVPEKFSLTALINSLMGKEKTYTYYLVLNRNSTAVNVYLESTSTSTTR
jgi:cytochrome c oxidase assembly protein Cox11